MRHRIPTMATAGFAVAMVFASLAGCAPATDETDLVPEQTFDDHASALAEYEAATLEFDLPPGQTYPPAPFDDDSGVYETGYGTSVVVTIWNCAWGREYLLLRGESPEAAGEALEKYASLMETDAYHLYYDPVSVHPVFESAVENAQLGDPTLIQSLIAGGCP